jgi:hypothetical protein
MESITIEELKNVVVLSDANKCTKNLKICAQLLTYAQKIKIFGHRYSKLRL